MMTPDVITMVANTPLTDVFKTLYERHVGSVVIVNEERGCEGIFTERDAIRVVAMGISLGTTLRDVMTKNVLTLREDASFAEAKQLFTTHGIRHLPVVDDENHLIGMLSVRSILDELVGL
jgi:CBS domain-containing protein